MIGIDQMGEIFEDIVFGDIEGGDASAFPFFTGKEDQEEGHGTDRTVAQEGSTDLPPPPPHLVATPDGPVPTVDRTKRPLIFETVPSNAAVQRMETASGEQTDTDSAEGSSTKPATGNYLYLPKIGRYYSLPDDVKRSHKIQFVSCIPEEPCPAPPFLIYQRGEAIIGIDQMGQIFDDIGEDADASAFPFFTGKEDQEEGQ